MLITYKACRPKILVPNSTRTKQKIDNPDKDYNNAREEADYFEARAQVERNKERNKNWKTNKTNFADDQAKIVTYRPKIATPRTKL